LNQNDINLIQTAKRGNIDAFTELVGNYKNFVFRTAYGVVQSRPDAEDVTQETFIKAYQSLKTLQNDRTFPTWLARIVVRTALDFVQRRQRQPTATLHPEMVTTEDAHSQLDARMDLELALAKLSEEHRIVLVLREIQGFDYTELAEILNVPIGTVRSRLHHARAHLRGLLSGERGNGK
jgi:RNA polymerase sigma-70 factor, ECF subfamily